MSEVIVEFARNVRLYDLIDGRLVVAMQLDRMGEHPRITLTMGTPELRAELQQGSILLGPGWGDLTDTEYLAEDRVTVVRDLDGWQEWSVLVERPLFEEMRRAWDRTPA